MNLVIVDDDPIVCASLRTILQAEAGIHVAATGGSAAAAVQLYRDHRPDILLLDVQMPGLRAQAPADAPPVGKNPAGGLEAAACILQEDPAAKILLLTTFSDDEYIVQALLLGVKGYLIKQDVASIPSALQAVMNGQSVFGSEITSKLPALMRRQSAQPDLSALNEREREVAVLAAQGLTNKEIAARLFLSEGTVRNYLSAAMEKLQLRGRAQLAAWYYRLLSL